MQAILFFNIKECGSNNLKKGHVLFFKLYPKQCYIDRVKSKKQHIHWQFVINLVILFFHIFPFGKYFITDAQQVSGCLWFARWWPECCLKLTETGKNVDSSPS